MRISHVFVLILLSIQLESQTLAYQFDPSLLSILDTNSGDTLLSARTIIQAHQDFRIKKDAPSGRIDMRALTDPRIVLWDAIGNKKIVITTNFLSSGDSRIITDELEIKGGSDIAELFEINADPKELSPGTLVSLDPEHAGKLVLSRSKYDRNVVGVISGANGVKPGILMGQEGTLAHGGELVTISGRTYVKCNTSNGAIAIGDLLTSSDFAGVAMKANNKRKSRGSVIGKAMSPLTSGDGFVLVLVNLQ